MNPCAVLLLAFVAIPLGRLAPARADGVAAPAREVTVYLDPCVESKRAEIVGILALELSARVNADAGGDRARGGAAHLSVRCEAGSLLLAIEGSRVRSLARRFRRDAADAPGGARSLGLALAELVAASDAGIFETPPEREVSRATRQVRTTHPATTGTAGWRRVVAAVARMSPGEDYGLWSAGARGWLDAPSWWGVSFAVSLDQVIDRDYLSGVRTDFWPFVAQVGGHVKAAGRVATGRLGAFASMGRGPNIETAAVGVTGGLGLAHGPLALELGVDIGRQTMIYQTADYETIIRGAKVTGWGGLGITW